MVIRIDKDNTTLEEKLKFPRVGDIIEWVNLLEVWASDKWVEDGGPYFGISQWEDGMVKAGIVIEESIVEDIFHWTVWSWKLNKCFHLSSTTDKTRVISRCKEQDKHILSFYLRKQKK
tara:strand:+ start:180 stop:533 length:354 start_codon:yes stop_codon:yes gene_type:complete